jgi:hypothetical protein
MQYSNRIYFSLMTAFLAIFVTMASFSASARGGANGGGGSGISAEVERATAAFIQIVRQNPNIFEGVNADYLESFHPDILVTKDPIKFCNNLGDLDADSDSEQNYSRFNLAVWIAKDWFGKIFISGHERLVLAGLERSNEYQISNKLYSHRVQSFERENGTLKTMCDFGAYACDEFSKLQGRISSVIEMSASKIIDLKRAKLHLDMIEESAQIVLLVLKGHEEFRVTRHLFNFNNEQKLKDYNESMQMAYEKQFRPIFIEAIRVLEEDTLPPKCVKNKLFPFSPRSAK